MKTIFDKIDPEYIECGTGICNHVEHSHITLLYVIAVVILTFSVILMLKTKQTGHN